jgi:LAO/AO transport system kinase
VENETEQAQAVLEAAFPRTGSGFRVGITGPPGAGKSTLVSSLTTLLRQGGEKVAVVAVDPTSPFSGGALLGDRVRMPKLAGDPGVFIRSMASRGSLGGLAVTTSEVCDVLEAAGFHWILIETVGVGQSELEVAENADTVVVVLVPESGDGVQAMKAGLMEIGDLFVLNKADRDGADRAAGELKAVLGLKPDTGAWRPPVILTEAREGRGVDELKGGIEGHLEYLRQNDRLRQRRRRRLKGHVVDLIRARASERLRRRVDESRWDAILGELEERKITPHRAADRLWKEAWPGDGPGTDSESGRRRKDR